MTRIITSNAHHAHLLLMNVLMVLAVFTMSGNSTSSVTPLKRNVNDQPPAIFVLGDSLVDAGNINYVNHDKVINKYPFGIDFPSGKRFTGRFTNGRTFVDIIGDELGLKDYIPSSLDPTAVGDVVLHGVNYACGGAGILNDTGAIFGNRINMDAQLDYFANTRNYIISNISSGGCKKLVEKALFIIVVGSNEFIDNYFLPIVSIPKQKLESPEMFVDSMISKFRLQLTRLYAMDARKILVVNVGPVGCIPIERVANYKSWYARDSCVSAMNNAAMLFNKKLKRLIMELNSNLVQSKFVYGDTYSMFTHVVNNYKSYGFEDYKTGCYNLVFDPSRDLHNLSPSVCKDRSKYVFWDIAHPTEAFHAIIANKLLEDGHSRYTYPMNVRQLYYS